MKTRSDINKMQSLERETLLVLVLNIVMEGVSILFPKGEFQRLRWFSFSKWIGLGKLMLKVIDLFRSEKD